MTTNFLGKVLGGGIAEEALPDDLDEEFDALNDETFGGEPPESDDWQFEQLAEITEGADHDFRNVEELWEDSISQLIAEDDDEPPGIIIPGQRVHRKSSGVSSTDGGMSHLGSSTPQNPFLDAEHLQQSKPNIWGSPGQQDAAENMSAALSYYHRNYQRLVQNAGSSGYAAPHATPVGSFVSPQFRMGHPGPPPSRASLNGYLPPVAPGVQRGPDLAVDVDSRLRNFLGGLQIGEESSPAKAMIQGAKTVEELEAEFRHTRLRAELEATEQQAQLLQAQLAVINGSRRSQGQSQSIPPPVRKMTAPSCEEIEEMMRNGRAKPGIRAPYVVPNSTGSMPHGSRQPLLSTPPIVGQVTSRSGNGSSTSLTTTEGRPSPIMPGQGTMVPGHLYSAQSPPSSGLGQRSFAAATAAGLASPPVVVANGSVASAPPPPQPAVPSQVSGSPIPPLPPFKMGMLPPSMATPPGPGMPPFPPPIGMFPHNLFPMGLPPPHLVDPKLRAAILAYLAQANGGKPPVLIPPAAQPPSLPATTSAHSPSCPMPVPSQVSRRNRVNSATKDAKSTRGPFTCLMSKKEKDWVAMIQMRQVQSDNPWVADYYWANYRSTRRRRLPSVRPEDEDDPYLQPRRDGGGGDNFPVIYVPPTFEGSLGKVQVLSAQCPRMLIDLKKSASIDSNEDSDGASSGRNSAALATKGGAGEKDGVAAESVPSLSASRRFKCLLMELENIFSVLLDCEDAEKQLQVLPKEASRQLDAMYRIKLSQLAQHFQTERLPLLLSVPKGRQLFSRLLYLVPKAEAVNLIRVLMKSFSIIVKRDLGNDYHRILSPAVLQAVNRLHGSDFSKLVSDSALCHYFSNWDSVIRNDLAYQVLFRLIKHSACLPDFETPENWQSFLHLWAEAVHKLKSPPMLSASSSHSSSAQSGPGNTGVGSTPAGTGKMERNYTFLSQRDIRMVIAYLSRMSLPAAQLDCIKALLPPLPDEQRPGNPSATPEDTNDCGTASSTSTINPQS